MVWTHTTPPQAQHVPDLAPWVGRIAARLRALFAEFLPATDVISAPRRTAEDSGLDLFTDAAPISAFTRVGPFDGVPLAPAANDATPAPVVEAACAAQFHACEIEELPLVLVLSRRASPTLPCLDWLADHALPFRRLAALHPTSPIWSAPRGAMLLVDLDTLGGIGTIVEGLMRLRLGRPDIAVILLTEEMDAHDFGTERLVVADITLRLPCAFASFEFALAEAPINNALWQERLAEGRT